MQDILDSLQPVRTRRRFENRVRFPAGRTRSMSDAGGASRRRVTDRVAPVAACADGATVDPDAMIVPATASPPPVIPMNRHDDPDYPRDLVGYGRDVPHARWPGGARIAVQFVLNYEEGGENSVLHGDRASETFLSEIIGAAAYRDRHLSMESLYEYGSRVGVWRILREFERVGWPLTVFGVGMALARHPDVVRAFLDRDDEIASHGLRWIHYQEMPEAEERAHVGEATRLIRALTGDRWPLGWYTGRDSPNTRRLVADEGGYLYDSDYYGDDLPFWTAVAKSDGTRATRLVVPYTLDANDMRFASPQGFNTGDHFFTYLRDAFDALYGEGDPAGLDRPKMMSVGMHCRILGKPGRIGALRRFIDHVAAHERVWVCRRVDVARHWMSTHPFEAAR